VDPIEIVTRAAEREFGCSRIASLIIEEEFASLGLQSYEFFVVIDTTTRPPRTARIVFNKNTKEARILSDLNSHELNIIALTERTILFASRQNPEVAVQLLKLLTVGQEYKIVRSLEEIYGHRQIERKDDASRFIVTPQITGEAQGNVVMFTVWGPSDLDLKRVSIRFGDRGLDVAIADFGQPVGNRFSVL
jgi:hypothetical protein